MSWGGPVGRPTETQELLDAVVAVGSELELHDVLDRILVSACTLTRARYGALGVICPDGRELSDFLTCGVDPGDHPPTTSLLDVPVLVGGQLFGNLTLAGKDGGAPFTEQDESFVQALADAAGFVIEQPRARAHGERQRAWVEAATRLGEALQSPLEKPTVLQQVAAATRASSSARAVGILRLDEADQPVLVASDGPDADQLPEVAARLVDRIEDAARHGQHATVGLGSKGAAAAVLPLRARLLGSVVLLVVTRADGTEPTRPGPDARLLTRRAVDSDRERIARDLHDLVIQRLFATGMQLQGIRDHAVLPEVLERVDQAIDDLDLTIRDIRSTIYDLQQDHGPSLRSGVQGLAREYSAVLGFTPTVSSRGPVDTVVPAGTGKDLLVVLREALSNVAQHAQATRVDIALETDATTVHLQVTDDGRGLPTTRHESGLANLRERASGHAGTLRVLPVEPHGTRLDWVVPIHPGLSEPPPSPR